VDRRQKSERCLLCNQDIEWLKAWFPWIIPIGLNMLETFAQRREIYFVITKSRVVPLLICSIELALRSSLGRFPTLERLLLKTRTKKQGDR
jgi:hypothetical protein